MATIDRKHAKGPREQKAAFDPRSADAQRRIQITDAATKSIRPAVRYGVAGSNGAGSVTDRQQAFGETSRGSCGFQFQARLLRLY